MSRCDNIVRKRAHKQKTVLSIGTLKHITCGFRYEYGNPRYLYVVIKPNDSRLALMENHPKRIYTKACYDLC